MVQKKKKQEIIGLKMMEYGDFIWRSISLLCEKAELIITPKVYVFSESILSQGEVNNPSTANKAWKKKIEWLEKNYFRKNLKVSLPKIHNVRDPRGNSKTIESIQCEPE